MKQSFFIDSTDEWVDIPGYGGHYAINRNGDVMSKSRQKRVCGGGYITLSARFLSKHISGTGYYVYSFSDGTGRATKVYVHRLLANAFIPNPNGYTHINHIDGNKLNNDVSNLEWCTQRQNIHHYMRSTGRRHITESDGIRIVNMINNGVPVKCIAESFDHNVNTIKAIKNRKTWRDIQ